MGLNTRQEVSPTVSYHEVTMPNGRRGKNVCRNLVGGALLLGARYECPLPILQAHIAGELNGFG